MTGETAYSIRAVQRVCDILDIIQSRPDGLTLADFDGVTDFAKSSVFRYLATLEVRGYVVRDDAGVYRQGLRLMGERLGAVVRRMEPVLARIRDEFGETVNLGMLDGPQIVYLSVVESKASIRNAPRAGEREPLHCTALGKVLAAKHSDEFVRAVLQGTDMSARTDSTITSIEEFLAELELTRTRGFGLDDEENEVGGRCIAVAIPAMRQPVAISVSAPAQRLPREVAPDWAARVTEIVSGISAPDGVEPVEASGTRAIVNG